MRQIKFRAWDGDNMWYHFIDEIGGAGVECDGIFIPYSDLLNPEYRIEYTENTGKVLVVMQYTGLKDKNGKEIYEGDILEQTHNGQSFKTVVRFESYGFENNDEGIGYGFYHEPKTKIVPQIIIGNIYENKDLLQ